MKYQIEITGMHCTGCSNLIKMTLEDEELANVKCRRKYKLGNI